MGLANCIWCESDIRSDCKVCPECSLENPVAPVVAVSRGARRRKAATRGGRWLLLMLFAVPLMLSAAYAAHSTLMTGAEVAPLAEAAVVSAPPPSAVTDPVQRGVWLNGMQAVRLALADPGFADFQQTYIRTSAGRVVSLCGTIPSGQLVGLRFVSVAGDSAQTVIEGRDPSFGTLWTRLCERSDTV